MTHSLKALLAAVLLVGCTTPEQQAANMQAQVDSMMRIYGPACTRLGYPASSDPWRNCVLQLSAKEDMERYGYPTFYAGYGSRYWGMAGRWHH